MSSFPLFHVKQGTWLRAMTAAVASNNKRSDIVMSSKAVFQNFEASCEEVSSTEDLAKLAIDFACKLVWLEARVNLSGSCQPFNAISYLMTM